MPTPASWYRRAADILLDERNKRYLGMTEPTDKPHTAAGRALFDSYWEPKGPQETLQAILAIEAEAAGWESEAFTVDDNNGDAERDFVAEATTPEEYRQGNATPPASFVPDGWPLTSLSPASGPLDVDRIAAWLESAYGYAFRGVDWKADAAEIVRLANEEGEA